MVITNSKRVIAGSLFLLFWTVLFAVRDLPLSTGDWAALGPLRCPLAYFFEITCPTCGLGRSLVAAALGHGQESFRYHPLGWPLFWGSQGLGLCWMLFPQGWQALRRLGRRILSKRPLLWFMIVLYGVWGFCWRAPI